MMGGLSASPPRRNHQPELYRKGAQGCPARSPSECDPDDRHEQQIEEPDVLVGAGAEGDPHDQQHRGGLGEQLPATHPEPGTRVPIADRRQQYRRQRQNAVEISQPVAPDTSERLERRQYLCNAKGADIQHCNGQGDCTTHHQQPHHAARRFHHHLRVTARQQPRDQCIAAGDGSGSKQEQRQRRGHITNDDLRQEGCDQGDDGAPMSEADEIRERQSRLRTPRRDAQLQQRLHVADPVDEDVSGDVAARQQQIRAPRQRDCGSWMHAARVVQQAFPVIAGCQVHQTVTRHLRDAVEMQSAMQRIAASLMASAARASRLSSLPLHCQGPTQER